ncbi:MAG: hypothetical protein J7K81_02850 [Methanophagales archaeon]|nr:hypothetical protein [Methanophagales archaeon]
MIATPGDEAFVMLALFPKEAVFLFAVLFILGIIGVPIADKAASLFKIVPCQECTLQKVHKEECRCFAPEELKRFPKLSLPRYALFSFLFILLVDLEGFVRANMILIFLICALVGLIPESGPHMIFVMMFASGLVPFSILLTSSIVQDGHGMLPLLSYTIKDSVLIKLFNLLFAIVIGLPLFLLGV